MPYTKLLPRSPQPDTPEAAFAVQLEDGGWIAPDEIGVLLDTGERVAISCTVASRDYATQQLTLVTAARVLTADGGTVVDAGQSPAHVATQWTHTTTPSQIAEAGGLDALRRDCLRAVLGEAPLARAADGVPVLNLPDDLRQQVSIRTALATATLLGRSIDHPDPL